MHSQDKLNALCTLQVKTTPADIAKAICPQLAIIHMQIHCHNDMEVLKGSFMSVQSKKPTKYYAQNLSVSLRIHYIYALHFEHFFRLTFSSTTVFQQYLWEILNIKQIATAIQNKLKNELQNYNDFSYYNLEVLLVACRCVWSHLFWYSKQLSPTDVFSPAKK